MFREKVVPFIDFSLFVPTYVFVQLHVFISFTVFVRITECYVDAMNRGGMPEIRTTWYAVAEVCVRS